MFLLTIYERRKGKGRKKRGEEEGLEFFYRFFCKFIPMYMGWSEGARVSS